MTFSDHIKAHPPILGREFIEMLREVGFISADEFVQRVIIVADLDEYLTIHVQRVGDKRILHVAPLVMKRMEVTRDGERPPETPGA
jgi:hypothetical protein